jgi:Zn-dependent peptidase ImmA (M78 family)
MRGKTYATRQAKKLWEKYAVDPALITKRNLKKIPINLEKVVNDLGVTIIEHEFSDDISGLFLREDKALYIGVNQGHHDHRKRFTIAHEIGHYILHADNVLHYDTNSLDSSSVVLFRSEGPRDLNEIEANAFAAEFLMPEPLIKRCIELSILSTDRLADVFQVSEAAMRYRLINLGYI